MGDNSITSPFTDEESRGYLDIWLEERSSQVVKYLTVSYFTYSGRPFWAIMAIVAGWGINSLWGEYGFHIYQDGDVRLIYRQGM